MHTVKQYLSLGIAVGLWVSMTGCGVSIHDASRRGDLGQVKALLEANPDLCESRDRLDKTPLHQAVAHAQPEVFAYLVEAGCDINAQDRTGMTPLHVAAFIDLPGAAAGLLSAGADLEARDSFGDTPLHTAALVGAERVVKLLLRRGADPSVKNEDGNTPRALALDRGHDTIAELLAAATGNDVERR